LFPVRERFRDSRRALYVLFVLFSIPAFAHDGIVEAGAEGVWKLVNLIISIDLNGLFGGIKNHMAFVAPMQVLIKFSLKTFSDLAVKVI
jgi:hypothetical protein